MYLHRYKFLVSALILAALSLAGCSDSENNKRKTTEKTTKPASNLNEIIYVSGATGTKQTHDIYLVKPSGGPVRQLTHSSVDEFYPTWSPDHNQIAFTDGNTERICIIDRDGKNQHCITDRKLKANTPSWSPNGKLIAFSGKTTQSSDIYVIEPDGSNLKRLTTRNQDEDQPSWSPDGKEMVFASLEKGSAATAINEEDGQYDIFIMQADGKSPRKLFGHKTVDEDNPKWSPDGKRIAIHLASGSTYGFAVINPSGKLLDNTPPMAYITGLSWSPDGKELALGSSQLIVTKDYSKGVNARYHFTQPTKSKSPAKTGEQVLPAWSN